MAQWSAHEDEQLRKLVKEYGPKRWSVIASKLKTKGSKQCRRRWKNHLNADLKSGGWTAEEDRILMEGHRLHGNKWTEIAKMVGGRTDNAVKNRYAALCKRDAKGAPRGGAARGGRGGRKPRASDSDAGASDVEMDDESEDNEDAKRTSSASVSREASPIRGGRGGHGVAESAPTNSTPPRTRGTHAASPPLAKAAATAAAEADALVSTGVRSSVLGRRRQPGGGSPPLQPEPEAAGPSKRRGLLPGGAAVPAAAASRPQVSTPQTPLVQMPQMQQPQEALLTAYQQHQQQRPVPERLVLGGRSGSAGGAVRVPELDGDDQGPSLLQPQQREEQQEAMRRASSGGREGDTVTVGQPKKLPLTIKIPNAASAEPHAVQPPSAAATAYGIEIRVPKNLLTPCEIQYVRELNDMQLPLHINVDDDSSGALAGRSSGGSALVGAASAEPPLTTSRQAAQNALTALFSPGCLTSGAASDFNDVLKWFQTGFTPRSAACGDDMTPRLMSRMGLTPCGLSGGGGSRGGGHCVEDAGMLGTGLTPKCLLDSGSPRGHRHSGGSGSGIGGMTPQMAELSAAKRARRQVAVAAAVAAAANEPAAAQQPQDGLQGMGSGVQPLNAHGTGAAAAAAAAALGMSSPGGMELHAGHRLLLTKLIQTAAAADAGAPGGAGAGGSGAGGSAGDADGGRLSGLAPPSPSAGMVTPAPLPGRGSLTRNASGDGVGPSQQLLSAGSSGVVVMPYFTQQELLLLLEVLNSDDLQALPPPPPGQ